MHNYHDTNGSFPFALIQSSGGKYSCFVGILPYLEQGPLFASYNLDLTSKDVANRTTQATMVSTYLCPSMTLPYDKPNFALNDFLAPTSYAASNGDAYADLYSRRHLFGVPRGVIIGDSTKNTGDTENPLATLASPVVSVGSITDGSSNTLFLGEQDYALKNDFFSSSSTRAGQFRGGQGVWGHGYPRGLNFSTWGKFNHHEVHLRQHRRAERNLLVPQPAPRRGALRVRRRIDPIRQGIGREVDLPRPLHSRGR